MRSALVPHHAVNDHRVAHDQLRDQRPSAAAGHQPPAAHGDDLLEKGGRPGSADAGLEHRQSPAGQVDLPHRIGGRLARQHRDLAGVRPGCDGLRDDVAEEAQNGALGHVHVLRDDHGRLDDTLGVEIPLQQRQIHAAIMPDEQG